MTIEDTKMSDAGRWIIRGDACIVGLVGMPNASTSTKKNNYKE